MEEPAESGRRIDRQLVAHGDVALDAGESAAETEGEELGPAADAPHGAAEVESPIDGGVFERVAPEVERIPRDASDVVSAGEDEAGGIDGVEPARGIGCPRGDRHREAAGAFEEASPTHVEAVAVLGVGVVTEEALADRDELHETTLTDRAAQSMWRTDARDQLRKFRSFAPMTAGRPSSAHRIAMWELTPPNWVTRPAIPLVKR